MNDAPVLAELEHQFLNYLLGAPLPPSFMPVVRHADRLAVYRNNYQKSQEDILNTAFSELQKFLTPARFKPLIQDYLKQHPSQEYSIRWIGRHFAEFCENQSDLPAGTAEWAAFEWALTLAFDAADSGIISSESLSLIHPEIWPDLRFTLHASVHLLVLHHLIPSLYAQASQLQTGECLPASVLIKTPEPVSCLIWRDPDLKVQYRTLETDEAILLEAIQANHDFGSLCEILFEQHPENCEQIPLQAASFLKNWLQSGLISEIVFNHAAGCSPVPEPPVL